MVRSAFVSLAALGLLAVSAPASAASLVTVNFTGFYNLNFSGSETGAISGQFTYNTGLSHHSGAYYDQAITGFSLTSPILNDLTGASTATDVAYPGSGTGITYASDYFGSGEDHIEFNFQLATAHFPQFSLFVNVPGGTFTPGLPSGVPDYTQAVSAGLTFYDTYGDNSHGYLTSLTSSYVTVADPSAAPEPSSWAMMLVGFGAMGATMRRRTKIAFA